MPNNQKSLPPSRSLHPLAGSHLTLGGCEHGLCVGFAKDIKEQGLHLCGGRPILKDGPFHTL